MNPEAQLEFEILQYIKEWSTDPDKATDNGAPFIKPKTLTLVPSLEAFSTTAEMHANWRRLHAKLAEMADRGLLSSPVFINRINDQRLTSAGYGLLEKYERTAGVQRTSALLPDSNNLMLVLSKKVWAVVVVLVGVVAFFYDRANPEKMCALLPESAVLWLERCDQPDGGNRK